MKCICCQSENFSRYTETSYLDLPSFQCQNCQLIVTGKTKDEVKTSISKSYKDEFWNEQKEIFGDMNEEFSDNISKGKKRNFVSQYKFCKPFFENRKKLLEIGSGMGQTIFWLDEMEFNSTGIEPDCDNANKINSKLKNSKVLCGYFDDHEINEEFEIIWSSHVFEHLIEPELFLEKIKGNISQESVIFLEVPNCEHSPTLDDSIFGSPHVYHFTKKTLTELIIKHGYEIISCKVFRPATKVEGILNKYFGRLVNKFPYYPRIECDEKQGRDLRIIFKLKNI